LHLSRRRNVAENKRICTNGGATFAKMDFPGFGEVCNRKKRSSFMKTENVLATKKAAKAASANQPLQTFNQEET